MTETSPEEILADFIARYTPEIALMARGVLARMRRCFPSAIMLVYDNYNALVIGFGPTERASEAIFSIVLYPRWVSLFFLQGANLPDPRRLLQGQGKAARHIVLEKPEDLDSSGIKALMSQALKHAIRPLDRKGSGRLVIKSVSAKQRARRPARASVTKRNVVDSSKQ